MKDFAPNLCLVLGGVSAMPIVIISTLSGEGITPFAKPRQGIEWDL